MYLVCNLLLHLSLNGVHFCCKLCMKTVNRNHICVYTLCTLWKLQILNLEYSQISAVHFAKLYMVFAQNFVHFRSKSSFCSGTRLVGFSRHSFYIWCCAFHLVSFRVYTLCVTWVTYFLRLSSVELDFVRTLWKLQILNLEHSHNFGCAFAKIIYGVCAKFCTL